MLIRLAGAAAFLYHGSQILFGAFGGPGPEGFAKFMHLPAFIGVLVGIGEFGGGLSYLTGVLTRIGASGIGVIMVGAILLVHLKNGFSIANNGFEYPLTQLLIALALMIRGAGSYSLNIFLKNKKVET